MISFTFPWPPSTLSPNARVDRWTKANAVKAYRKGVAWEAIAAGVKKLDPQRLHLTVTFCPPDMRNRDIDNLVASIKAAIDGIADVLGVDDSLFDYTFLRGATVKNGRVCAQIGAPADAASVPIVGIIS